jgi:hypothetical protein
MRMKDISGKSAGGWKSSPSAFPSIRAWTSRGRLSGPGFSGPVFFKRAPDLAPDRVLNKTLNKTLNRAA